MWLRTLEGDLINLDHIARVEALQEAEGAVTDEDRVWAVVLAPPGNGAKEVESTRLDDSLEEDQALALLDWITTQMTEEVAVINLYEFAHDAAEQEEA